MFLFRRRWNLHFVIAFTWRKFLRNSHVIHFFQTLMSTHLRLLSECCECYIAFLSLYFLIGDDLDVFYAVKLQYCLIDARENFRNSPCVTSVTEVRWVCDFMCWKWSVYLILRHALKPLCFAMAICCNEWDVHLLPLGCFLSKGTQLVIYAAF